MATKGQQRTTAFVTLPILFLAIAALCVVLGSLAIGARESDTIALSRQRETLAHAIEQHGNSLGRELRVQTVWNEAYEKTRALDQNWIHTFYGNYLDELFGYDRLYVLSGDNKPIWGWIERRDDTPEQLAATVSQWSDLVAAVRKPDAAGPRYQVVTTPIVLGNGQTIEHRAVADVRNIGGNPAMVVVSTIVPDHATPQPFVMPTFLLVAVEYLDADFTRRLGADFEFSDLHWIAATPPKIFSAFDVKSAEGSPGRDARLAQGPAGLGLHQGHRARARNRAVPCGSACSHSGAMGQPAGKQDPRERGGSRSSGQHRCLDRPP